jgi:NTP pyrophosphatase (non-canonical NTP hydrolase)
LYKKLHFALILKSFAFMNFNDYQQTIERFAIYPRENELLAASYVALGLNGEAGEVAEAVKKAIRNDGRITDERRSQIADELGDVLWYLARMATELDLDLTEIAHANVAKLDARRAAANLKHE